MIFETPARFTNQKLRGEATWTARDTVDSIEESCCSLSGLGLSPVKVGEPAQLCFTVLVERGDDEAGNGYRASGSLSLWSLDARFAVDDSFQRATNRRPSHRHDLSR